jgi:4-amino-4-deoxy-L-arabinose transferase-like glycosyltransferase
MKFVSKIIAWCKSIDHALLLIILGLASFMRLYRIQDYMTFLGDEGRDMLVARQILHGDLVFIGPRASAGDFFLGPIYYYFIAPFLLIFDYNPVGPAVFVALLGIASVYLVYLMGKDFFGKWAGLSAAALYAISPLVIAYSRSSWNPNPVPFFTLFMLYVLYHGIKLQKQKLFLIAGGLFGILMQLHYIVVFLGIIVFLYILIGDKFVQKKFNFLQLIKQYLVFAGGFVITFSPFLLFEIKNKFPNTKTIFDFIFKTTVEKQEGNGKFLDIVSDVFIRLFGRLLLRFPPIEQIHLYTSNQLLIWKIAIFVIVIFSIIFLIRSKQKLVILLFALWAILGIVLFGFYKKPIYDYYFGFLFPMPFLLFGNVLANFPRIFKKGISRFVAIGVCGAIFAGIFVFNLYGAPFRYEPNKQMAQMRRIAEFTLSKTDGKPYNFALLTPGNSDHAYRYFFEVEGHPPVTIENAQNDPQRKTVTDQLLIVCEYGTCAPLGESLWEVAGFGRAEIVGQWPVPPVTVYKLKHYTGK